MPCGTCTGRDDFCSPFSTAWRLALQNLTQSQIRLEWAESSLKGAGKRCQSKHTSVNNPCAQRHGLRGWDTAVAPGLTHCIHKAFWGCCKEQGMLGFFSWCTSRAILPVTVQQPRCCQTNVAGKNSRHCASGGSKDRAPARSGQEMGKGRGALGKL